jgi:hypothetical protein
MAFMADLSADAATKECKTQACVQVAASTFNLNDDPCWLTGYDFANKTFTGRAYSTTFAGIGLGQDSKGGNPGDQITNGKYWECNGTDDCGLLPQGNRT